MTNENSTTERATATHSLDGNTFKEVLRGHPGGVAVITADDGTGPVALTATSVASVSAEPPLLVFSTSAIASASPVINAAETLVIHLLDTDDLGLARLASTSGIDRFADQELWRRLPTGEPIFNGVRAWLRCVVVDRIDAAGSTVTIVRALEGSVDRQVGVGDHGNALIYHNRTWHRLSNNSKVAPPA